MQQQFFALAQRRCGPGAVNPASPAGIVVKNACHRSHSGRYGASAETQGPRHDQD
jgi:hypothetical protein